MGRMTAHADYSAPAVLNRRRALRLRNLEHAGTSTHSVDLGVRHSVSAIRSGIRHLGAICWRQPLDQISATDHVRTLIDEMTRSERNAHFRMTATLDMAFPFIYGALYCGVALRFLGRAGPVAVVIVVGVVALDLLENTAQLLALGGRDFLLPLKSLATPIKNVLSIVILGVTILTFLTLGIRRIGRTIKR